MKKFLICLLALTSATHIFAQNKGDKYIGGNFGITTSTSIANDSSLTGFGFAVEPEFGVFVADRFRIGASVGYALETANRTDPVGHAITVLPNMAYYVRLADNFYYTPTLSLGFVCSIAGETSMTETMVMPGFGLGLSLAGFEFRPTPKLGIALNIMSLDYVFMRYKEGAYFDYKSSTINFKLGGNSSIGLRCYF